MLQLNDGRSLFTCSAGVDGQSSYARPIRQVQCINSVHGHISGGIYQILTLISQITGTEIDHLIDDHQVGYGIVPTLIGYIRVLINPFSSVTCVFVFILISLANHLIQSQLQTSFKNNSSPIS